MAKRGREKLTYWKAEEEIVELANKLLAAHNSDAVEASVCYMFRSKHTKRGGMVQGGTCSKVSDKDKVLHGYDYIVTLAADIWQELADREREALLLHELLHIGAEEDEQDGSMHYGINSHDTEEFRKVIEVCGLWRPDLEALAQTIEMRAVLDNDGEAPKVVKSEEVKFDDGSDDMFDE